MMTWFASILLLFMINIVQADGDPLTINVKQEIDDLCGCNHGCNTCDGRKCGNMGSPCGAGLMGTCRDKQCWEDEEKIDGEKCCHGADCVCCQCKGGCGGNCTNGVEHGTCMKEGHGRRIIKNAYCKGYSCQCGEGCHDKWVPGKCGYGDIGLCMEISGSNTNRTPVQGHCCFEHHCCAPNGGECPYGGFWSQPNTECSKYGASPTGIFGPFEEECCRSHEGCENTNSPCGFEGKGRCRDFSCLEENNEEEIDGDCHGADCVCCKDKISFVPKKDCVVGGWCSPECLWPHEEEVHGNGVCRAKEEVCCKEREPSTAPPTTTLPPGTTPIPRQPSTAPPKTTLPPKTTPIEPSTAPPTTTLPPKTTPIGCENPDRPCGDAISGSGPGSGICTIYCPDVIIPDKCEGDNCVCCAERGCNSGNRCGVEGIGTCMDDGCPTGEEPIPDAHGNCTGASCECCAPPKESGGTCGPCDNGTCINSNRGCGNDAEKVDGKCDSGYQCCLPVSECDPPCQNGGTCLPDNKCCCTDVTTGDRCEIHCPRKEHVVDGDGFGFHFCVKTYQEAFDFCQSYNWILATPDKQFENFNEVMPSRYEFWLDVLPNSTSSKFAKVTETGVWYWQTTPLNLTTPGQWQEDYVPATPPFCASMYKDYRLAGNICTRKWFFVCESDVFEEGREVGNFTAAYHQEQPNQRNPERHLKV